MRKPNFFFLRPENRDAPISSSTEEFYGLFSSKYVVYVSIDGFFRMCYLKVSKLDPHPLRKSLSCIFLIERSILRDSVLLFCIGIVSGLI